MGCCRRKDRRHGPKTPMEAQSGGLHAFLVYPDPLQRCSASLTRSAAQLGLACPQDTSQHWPKAVAAMSDADDLTDLIGFLGHTQPQVRSCVQPVPLPPSSSPEAAVGGRLTLLGSHPAPLRADPAAGGHLRARPHRQSPGHRPAGSPRRHAPATATAPAGRWGGLLRPRPHRSRQFVPGEASCLLWDCEVAGVGCGRTCGPLHVGEMSRLNSAWCRLLQEPPVQQKLLSLNAPARCMDYLRERSCLHPDLLIMLLANLTAAEEGAAALLQQGKGDMAGVNM